MNPELTRIETEFRYQRNWLIMAGMWPEISKAAGLFKDINYFQAELAKLKAKYIKRGRPFAKKV